MNLVSFSTHLLDFTIVTKYLVEIFFCYRWVNIEYYKQSLVNILLGRIVLGNQ
jgi:hypothetical protein